MCGQYLAINGSIAKILNSQNICFTIRVTAENVRTRGQSQTIVE